MSQTLKQEQTEIFQEVCQDTSLLDKAQSIFCRESVVMDERGNLLSEDKVRRGEDIMRLRKKLVLGMNGWEQHTLDETNEILERVPPSLSEQTEIERFINNELQ